MKWVLIGHRGVGKSDLLERMKSYFSKQQSLKFFDLDHEISKHFSKSVSQIFTEHGEISFRDIEQKIFSQICSQHSQYIFSVGAGFHLNQLPNDCKVLWVRRNTDSLGRIFFNRPRLNRSVSPLEEFFERYSLRQESYAAHAHVQYLMPEGLDFENSYEEQTLRTLMAENPPNHIGGILTLFPHHLRANRLELILSLSVDFFELRDDLLSPEDIQSLVGRIPEGKILLSFRKDKTDRQLIDLTRRGIKWDWASELGECFFGIPDIISYHQKIPNIGSHNKSHLKVSPEIQSFRELETWIRWQQQDPENRSFLPRSANQYQLIWIRLWLKGRQKLNFIKIDDGSAKDQPSLYQWISQPESCQNFSALLGNPVFHSRTPLEQQGFFLGKNLPIFAIDIAEDEFKNAFEFLDEMGMKAAAVTSPLKKNAASMAFTKSTLVEKFQSANTLAKNKVWHAENTDIDGFRQMVKEVPDDLKCVVIWGGGGTLPVIKEVLPHAIAYSVRTSDLRDPNIDSQEFIKLKLEGPEVLIWAAGADAHPPEMGWRPQIVLDLNYREDSLAREYALEVNAQYVDGLVMFRTQAKKQREFWTKYL